MNLNESIDVVEDPVLPKSLLVAVLASPPTTSGARTKSNLHHALAVTRCSEVLIVNLFASPTPDVPSMNRLGTDPTGWLVARPALEAAILRADEVLGGWGVNPLNGSARTNRTKQLHWLKSVAARAGIERVWGVGGEPRHPSRWHQYVSDVHGRTGPGATAERLAEVLQRQTWTHMLPRAAPSARHDVPVIRVAASVRPTSRKTLP